MVLIKTAARSPYYKNGSQAIKRLLVVQGIQELANHSEQEI